MPSDCARWPLILCVLAPPCHQLLIALEYIHGAKMVHGDIKPANVLLSADGSMLRLADFGLSRFLAETGGTRMGMSMHGAKRPISAPVTRPRRFRR